MLALGSGWGNPMVSSFPQTLSAFFQWSILRVWQKAVHSLLISSILLLTTFIFWAFAYCSSMRACFFCFSSCSTMAFFSAACFCCCLCITVVLLFSNCSFFYFWIAYFIITSTGFLAATFSASFASWFSLSCYSSAVNLNSISTFCSESEKAVSLV